MAKKLFGPGNNANPKGCPKGAHHIGRPPDEIKRECQGLATQAAPLILARLIQHSLGEKTEQVVTENGVELPVPAPVPSQIKASEVVLGYVLEKVAERLEINDGGRPSREELEATLKRVRERRGGSSS